MRTVPNDEVPGIHERRDRRDFVPSEDTGRETENGTSRSTKEAEDLSMCKNAGDGFRTSPVKASFRGN